MKENAVSLHVCKEILLGQWSRDKLLITITRNFETEDIRRDKRA
jgi:hypothetical protein